MPTTEKQLTKYFSYLDRLRDSAVTDMFGSPLYLERSFGLSGKKSSEIVRRWMETFDPKKSPAERAAEVNR